MTPHQAADKRVQLSVEYSRLSEQLEEILTTKPSKWMEIRKEVKSDKAADRAYDATPDGINEMKYRMEMKRKEKELSALSSLLNVYNQEANGKF